MSHHKENLWPHTLGSIFLALISACLLIGPEKLVAQQPTETAHFVFSQTSPKNEIKYFIFELTDANRIAEARAILANPAIAKRQVQGVVDPRRATYNPEWSFHLIPATIGFFEMQIEVCDANVTYVEEHLDEVGGSFLPKSFWCPWSSRMEREMK